MAKRNIARIAAVLLVAFFLLPAARVSAAAALAVERQVYDYLTEEMGLNSAAACGVLANIEHESNFNPHVLGDQGTSYGLCQWHNERYGALKTYCLGKGMDYRTVEGQMAYLDYELNSTYSGLFGALKTEPNTPDGAYRAGYHWCVQFERPVDPEKKGVNRGNLAKFKYWNRYNSIGVGDDEVYEEVLPQQVITYIQQAQVTIPTPPADETVHNDRYVAQKPAMKPYANRQKPAAAQEGNAADPIGAKAIGFAVGMVFQIMGDGRRYGCRIPEPEWTEEDIVVA